LFFCTIVAGLLSTVTGGGCVNLQKGSIVKQIWIWLGDANCSTRTLHIIALSAGTVNWENSEELELVATEFVCFDDNNNAVDRIGTDEFPGFILHRTSSVGDDGGRD
jgi:hypothetical protein